MVGAGRTEVIETIFGMRPKISGEIWINGKLAEINSPMDGIANKMGFLTEDRRATGIFAVLGVDSNIAIPNYDQFLSKIGLVDDRAVTKGVMNLLRRFRSKRRVQTGNPESQRRNQQKY